MPLDDEWPPVVTAQTGFPTHEVDRRCEAGARAADHTTSAVIWDEETCGWYSEQAYRAIKSRSLRSGAPANTANGPFVFDGKRESALQQQLRVRLKDRQNLSMSPSRGGNMDVSFTAQDTTRSDLLSPLTDRPNSQRELPPPLAQSGALASLVHASSRAPGALFENGQNPWRNMMGISPASEERSPKALELSSKATKLVDQDDAGKGRHLQSVVDEDLSLLRASLAATNDHRCRQERDLSTNSVVTKYVKRDLERMRVEFAQKAAVEDANAAAALEARKAAAEVRKAVQSSRQAWAEVQLTLAMDIREVAGVEDRVKLGIAMDLARAASGRPEHVHVERLRAGSVIAQVYLMEGFCYDGRLPLEAALDLEMQVFDAKSLLRTGVFTRNAVGLRIMDASKPPRPVDTSPQASHQTLQDNPGVWTAQHSIKPPVDAPPPTVHGDRMAWDKDADIQRSRRAIILQKSATIKSFKLEKNKNLSVQKVWPDPEYVEKEYSERSLFMLSRQNGLRRLAMSALEHPWWDRGVMAFIFLNTIVLLMFDPFDTEDILPLTGTNIFSGKSWPPLTAQALGYVGQFFSALFIAECLVRIVARGFILDHRSYLRRDGTNVLDFFIVLIGALDLLPMGNVGVNLDSLRLFRILRVMRTFTTFPELRSLVLVIIRSIRALFDAMLLCVFLFFVFGIFGVQLYRGALRGRCFDIESGSLVADDVVCSKGYISDENERFWSHKGMHVGLETGMNTCMFAESQCLELGLNPGMGSIHFDNIANAILAIFQVMTLEGWADFCYELQDSMGLLHMIYFVFLILLGPYFAVQLFLVILSANCADIGDSQEKVAMKEDLKRKSQNAARYRKSASKSTSLFAITMQKLERFAKSETLMNTVLFFIFINTVCMALEGVCTFEKDERCYELKGALEVLNVIFCVVFGIEFLIKIVGLGPRQFIQDPVNLLDVVIVVASLVELPSVLDAIACYMAAPEDSWTSQDVRLPTDVRDEYLSDHTIKMLTVKRAFNEDGKIVVNPLSYYACEGSGGVLIVLRAFRLVRLAKFLRGFPEIQKQVFILVDIIKSVVALIGLILITLLIFTVVGMTTFGGKVLQEYDPDVIGKGSSVYLKVPTDPNDLSQLYETHGLVKDFAFDTKTGVKLFRVLVEYGDTIHRKVVNSSMNYQLDSQGTVWAISSEHGDDFGSSLMTTGTTGAHFPIITGVAPRFHFDDFGHAFLTCFEVMTIANWNDNFYEAWPVSDWGSVIFYWALVMIGNWMLFNLFVAILIQKFLQQKSESDSLNMKAMRDKMIQKFGNLSATELAAECQLAYEVMDEGSNGIDFDEFQKGVATYWKVKFSPQYSYKIFRKYDVDNSGVISADEFHQIVSELLHLSKEQIEQQERLRAKFNPRIPVAKLCCCPGDLFPEDSLLRSMCKTIVENVYFEQFVFLCILLSSISLMIENKFIGTGSTLERYLLLSDIIVNSVFTLEFVLKIMAVGCRAYFDNSWNNLNLFIVVTSDLDMILSATTDGGAALRLLSAFRLLRALRILRIAASKFPGLYVLIRTASLSAAPLANTMVMVVAFLAVLGIIGIQLFSGKMNYCSDPSIWTMTECVGLDADDVPREWRPYEVNFNNMAMALITEMLMASQDDWPVHMWAGCDITGKVTGPMENIFMPIAPVYYMLVVIVTAAVLVNTVVGIFVENYYVAVQEREDREKREKHSAPLDARRIEDPFEVRFPTPKSGFRLRLFLLATDARFDCFIALSICVNTVIMSLESWKPPAWRQDFDVRCEFFFTFVFGAEAAIKLWALRPARYLSDISNAFDFWIVMLSYLGFAVGGTGIEPSVMRVFRIFRLMRTFRSLRMLKALKGLQAIVQTLVSALPAIGELAVMLLVIFLIFAVINVNLFGGMCVEGDENVSGLRGVRCLFTLPDNQLGRHAHFQGFGMSLFTLFRISTGDAWGEIMLAAGLNAPSRDPISQNTLDKYNELFGAAFVDPNNGVKPALTIAASALGEWKKITAGREAESGWPFPSGDGEQWIKLARLALPHCLTDEEAAYLSKEGLADCSIPGNYHSSGPMVCPGSCGIQEAACYIYFSLFFCISAFMLLQLVIGVLMDIFTAVESSQNDIIPGCEELSVKVFKRLIRRWQHVADRRSKIGHAPFHA